MGAFISSPVVTADGTTLTTTGTGAMGINPDGVEVWNHLETLTATASASVTSGALTAYDMYKVIISNALGSTTNVLLGRLNGLSTNICSTNFIDGTTPTALTAQNSYTIMGLSTASQGMAELLIDGLTSAVASGQAGIAIKAALGGGGAIGTGAIWAGGNAVQISSVTFFASTGTWTGKAEVFGRNRSA